MDDLQYFFEDLATRWDAHQPENRQEILLNMLAPFEETLRNARSILDVGTGTGMIIPCLRAFAPTARLVSIDLAYAMLWRARQRVPEGNLVQADVHRLPFASSPATFDVVVCHNCFPHFAQRIHALYELERIIIPGGKLLILHDLSRDQVNGIHSGAGYPIGNDLLPPGEKMQEMLTNAGFSEVWVEDANTHYMAVGNWGS